jgi:hypothetical protein
VLLFAFFSLSQVIVLCGYIHAGGTRDLSLSHKLLKVWRGPAPLIIAAAAGKALRHSFVGPDHLQLV